MQYKVTYTRPYLKGEEKFEVQRGVIVATSEEQVCRVFADCEILAIELNDPIEALTAAEYGDAPGPDVHQTQQDWGATSDKYKKSQPYHNDIYPYS